MRKPDCCEIQQSGFLLANLVRQMPVLASVSILSYEHPPAGGLAFYERVYDSRQHRAVYVAAFSLAVLIEETSMRRRDPHLADRSLAVCISSSSERVNTFNQYSVS